MSPNMMLPRTLKEQNAAVSNNVFLRSLLLCVYVLSVFVSASEPMAGHKWEGQRTTFESKIQDSNSGRQAFSASIFTCSALWLTLLILS